MTNINFKKYTRYYDGGYALTFYNALSGIIDYKIKNYTNFYLTRNTTLSELIESDIDTLKSDSILTTLNFGNSFLAFKEANQRQLGLTGIYDKSDLYGDHTFTSDNNSLSSNFIIQLKNNNVCNIYHISNYEKYYLTEQNNTLNFYTRSLGLTGIDFNYIYSKTNNAIFLFRNIGNIPFFVKKDGDSLTLVEMTSSNKILAYTNPIYMSKGIYTDFDINYNTTYIEYDTDNTIKNTGIQKNLKNNYILHRENADTDIIVLKNQLNVYDTFCSGNSLLSGVDSKFFVDGMRDYTSIFNDIPSEKDETLALNYITYNKVYKILPGDNTIIAPDNMAPFSKININDTKFIKCGSFAYPTPEYADKVYRIDTSINYSDDQTYLCTWLSGSPLSNDSVWVDRYYYPDLIEKENALASDNTFNITYENVIEQLVKNNTSIQDSIHKYTFFDKKSDMVFEPNQKYIYKRIANINPKTTNIVVTPCQNIENNSGDINYFKQLNESGRFTVKFYFSGDSINWILKSKRNNIDGGLSISKNSEYIDINLNLFNPGTNSVTSFTDSEKYKPLQTNFVCFSIDVIAGIGYFFLNNQIISTFNFDKTQFYGKNILFGDFIINDEDVFTTQKYIENFEILKEYVRPELAFTLPILEGKNKIDDIYITLPCGMRNSTDVIDLLQSVCSNQTYKSNDINIYVKNLNIEDDIEAKLSDKIKSEINRFTPITTEINNINFDNYK